MYILSIIKNIFVVLSEPQRVKFVVIFIFFLASALLQIVGVASIAPFITILSNQELIQSNGILSTLYSISGAESNTEFIIFFAIVSLLMIFASNFMSGLTLWLLLKFSVHIGSDLQCRLYKNFLQREYVFHKGANYNRTISIISQETPRFVYMVLQPFLLLVSHLFVAMLILIGLLVLNPWIAFASGLIIGGSYLITYIFVKSSLSEHGRIMTERNDGLQAILSESFIGIKDIKLTSMEKMYVQEFSKLNHKGLSSAAYIVLSGDLPKYVIETISFGAILMLAVILLLSSDSAGGVISILSVYALAGYKLLPTMQQIYKSVSSMSANGSVVEDLKSELQTIVPSPKEPFGDPIDKVSTIELKDAYFRYPSAESSTLRDVNVKFQLGKLNTIAGPSGSGKSTLADVVLGLLPLEKGDLLIDGQYLSVSCLTSYQRSIAYVPQSIFILDENVIANVAFGVTKDAVDIEKVKDALTKANALDFVEQLPQGLNTRLGQDGKRLSGGQRQRIGIARALYRNSKILILDEPTSALDIESEYDLMMLLNDLKNFVLTIVISHRPAAIKLSDTITLLDQGEVIASASYQELRENNSNFREILEKGMME